MASNDDLLVLVLELRESYPSFSVIDSTDEGLTIRGEIKEPCEYNGEQITIDIDIVIEISNSFPQKVPRVKEAIPISDADFHKLEGNYLCLGTDLECQIIVGENPNLIQFIKLLVLPYYFSFHSWKESGKVPFDDRPHGFEGRLQFLQEHFETKSISAIRKLLKQALQQRLKPFMQCECGSRKLVGDCHLEQISRISKYCTHKQITDYLGLLKKVSKKKSV